ncbi:hypothetical protein D3C72_275460 [compost metagenome]
MEAYSYIRFSSVKQEKGDSVRRQVDGITAFCDRMGWPIIEQIEDLGTSAWTGHHLSAGNLGQFAERVRRGEIKMPAVLVVEKLDRLSRQAPRKTLRWMEDLVELGLSIATVDGGRVYSDASLQANQIEVIEIIMRAELANKESTQKSERVLDAIGKNMRRAAAGGEKISAKGPGWLRLSEDRREWIKIEERVKTVRDIYERAAEGQGARWIAKALNESGVEAFGPPRKDGRRRTWEISSVRLLLAQPSVEGTYVPGFSNTSKTKTKFDEPIHDYFPRVVDADLVARARAAVEARKVGPRTGGRHTAAVANLFTSLAFCRSCGNRMHLKSISNLSNTRYLQCNHAARRRGCEQKEMFNYDALEGAVLDQILHLALDDRHFAKVDETGALAVVLAEIEKEIADAKLKGKRLISLALLTDDNAQVAAEIKENTKVQAALAERRVEAQAKLDAARGAVSPEEHLSRVRDLRGALQDEDKATRQAARLRVQSAMRAVGLRLECEVKPDGRRETLMMLKSGFFCRIAQDGTVVGKVDLVALAAKRLDVEGTADEAEATARLLRDAFNLARALSVPGAQFEDGEPEEEPVDPEFSARVGTHLRRQRENKS